MCCVLHGGRCVVCAVCCVLSAICCVLHCGRCMQCAVCCVLSAMCCVLCAMCCCYMVRAVLSTINIDFVLIGQLTTRGVQDKSILVFQ
jgi:hypothetical protein